MSSLDTVPDGETAKEIALSAPMRTYRVPARCCIGSPPYWCSS